MFGSVHKKNVLFVLAVTVSMIMVAAVVAESSDAVSEEFSGNCGDNLCWSYQKNTLYLSANDVDIPAEMNDFTIGSAPWSDLTIKKLSFSGNILSIGDYAFANSALLNVKLPEGIISIGDGAFLGSTSLYRISFPSSLESVGDRAFSGCSALYCLSSEAEVSDGFYGSYVFERTGFTTIPDLGGLKAIPEGMFSDSLLMNITVPEGIREIGHEAFSGCSEAESIYIPSTVEIIGNSAFETVESSVVVMLIEMEDSQMHSIGERAFAGHGSVMGEICVPAEYVGEEAFLGIGCNTVTFSDTVSVVGDRAFADSGISVVSLYDLSILSESAFENCGDVLFLLPETAESLWQDDVPGFSPLFGEMPSFFSLFEENDNVSEESEFAEIPDDEFEFAADILEYEEEAAGDDISDDSQDSDSCRFGSERPPLMTARLPVTVFDLEPTAEDISVNVDDSAQGDVPEPRVAVSADPIISGSTDNGYAVPAEPAEDKSGESMLGILLTVAAVITCLIVVVVAFQLKGRISS